MPCTCWVACAAAVHSMTTPGAHASAFHQTIIAASTLVML
jgi:hypothetical protein